MTPTVSVIVPVYNAEKYLQQCVDSILAQTFDNFELLLIDDGSKDRSGTLCDEYAKKDGRVRVFHKDNGGVSSARNIGLEYAVGTWVTFVDSDDCVSPSFMEVLLNNTDEDLVVGSFATFGNFHEEYILESFIYSKKQLSLDLNACLSKVHFSTSWGKFFKKNVLDTTKLRFSVNIDSTEDTLFVYKYMLYVNSVNIKSDITYFYRHTGEGLSCHNLPVDKAIKTIDVFYEVISSLEAEYMQDLSNLLYNVVNYVYLRSIRFIQTTSHSFNKRISIMRNFHSQIPSSFLSKYTPIMMGPKGRLFYWLANKRLYFVLTLYSYFIHI